MLEFTKEGIIYDNKLYKMSENDMQWVKEENRKNPTAHPARNLRSLAHTIYEID